MEKILFSIGLGYMTITSLAVLIAPRKAWKFGFYAPKWRSFKAGKQEPTNQELKYSKIIATMVLCISIVAQFILWFFIQKF